MSRSFLRTDKEIEEIYKRHCKTLYRVCFSYMKSAASTEDAVQETFFRLISKKPFFETPEHEKAWLIRTAVNICKDALKRKGNRDENIEDHPDLYMEDKLETNEVFQAVLQLPDKYKAVIYLYYYEGYAVKEIAPLLKMRPATVRSRLTRARGKLKSLIGGIDG